MAKSWNIYVFLCVLLSAFTLVESECTASNKRSTTELNGTESFQYLYSPGWRVSYLPAMDCKWLIDSGDANLKLIIDITYLNIEYSPGCAYDSLAIYDGDTTSSTKLDQMCSVLETGRMFVTSGRYALLRQKSDFSVQTTGFSLRYIQFLPLATTACTSTESVTASLSTVQYLNSESFPTLADDVKTCTWLVTASNGANKVEIEIIYLDLIGGEVCGDEKLVIYDGDSNSATALSRDMCEQRAVFPMLASDSYIFVTTQSKAFIELKTEIADQSRSGFLLSYKESASGVTPAPVVTTTTPTVAESCGGTFTASSGDQFISTPGYPDTFYSNNLDCNWVINVPAGMQITLDVVDSYIEDSEGCLGDKVTIYDGSTSTHPVLAGFCGENFQDVNSTGTSILINFRSDESTNARGFKLGYSMVVHDVPDCTAGSNYTNLNATDTIQYLSSTNYPSDYNDNTEERWLIYNPSGEGVIKVVVEDSRIEASEACSHDSVSVYKGPCDTYPQLGSFCGTDTPTYFQDKGSYVLIIFKSDDRSGYKGFRISYVLVTDVPGSLSTIVIVGIIVGCVLASLFLIAVILIIIKIIMKKRKGDIKKKKKKRKPNDDSDSSSDSSQDELDNSLDVNRVMQKKLPVMKMRYKPKLPKTERRQQMKKK